MKQQSIVAIENLHQTFLSSDKKAAEISVLKNINLSISAGKLTALVGPDGAGKSTLLRLIAGLYLPTSGKITVLGIDIAQNPQAVQDQISYMPQRFGLYEDLSVQENLNLYADLHGIPKTQRDARFSRLLQITDLVNFVNRPAGKLSGGMKQKLGLACTLVRSPELLLLDEPSVGVDPLSRRDIWTIIHQLVREENLSVILSTAYMDEAEYCDDVYIMYDGKFLQHGSPKVLSQVAKGLTWQVKPPENMKLRSLQSQLLSYHRYILDAVPKGALIRCITQPDRLSIPQECLPVDSTVEARNPELEDAFMFYLHQEQPTSQSYQSIDVINENPLSINNQPVIIVRDLVRKFGDFTAVASMSFDVFRGEVFGLLGPNGAGKTTTFRMLCGLLPASSGTLEVAGMNLRVARAEARAKIGYVSQKFALYGNLTVLDNLQFFGGAYGLSGKKLKQRIEQVLQQFELTDNIHSRSGDLPNGFKQRLSMAAALLHQPEILFLDKPTSGIDPLARRSFWYVISQLADQGITIIVTTHFMEEAEYCDRIAIQDAGKVLALGSPDEVRKQAGHSSDTDMNNTFIGIVENARQQKSVLGE